MTDRPIIFSGAMVRALLEGRKTQTRRLLQGKFTGEILEFVLVGTDTKSGRPVYEMKDRNGNPVYISRGAPFQSPHFLPPYAVGDRLYVRESYAPRYFDGGKDAYQADWTGESADCVPEPKWTPAIHQFKKASRITLTVEAVKVERLQDISDDDAKAEGCEPIYDCHLPGHEPHPYYWGFQKLWQSLNAKRAPWDSNPWVVVPQFKVHKCNIDKMEERNET